MATDSFGEHFAAVFRTEDVLRSSERFLVWNGTESTVKKELNSVA
jgi:hypothetical protein